MKTCRACGKELAGNARFCPECGYRFTHPFVKFIAWCFGIVLAAGMLGSMLDKGAKPSNDKPPTPAEDRAKSEADARVQAGYLGCRDVKGRDAQSGKFQVVFCAADGERRCLLRLSGSERLWRDEPRARRSDNGRRVEGQRQRLVGTSNAPTRKARISRR